MNMILKCLLVKGALISPDPLLIDQLVSLEKKEAFLPVVTFRREHANALKMNQMDQTVLVDEINGTPIRMIITSEGDRLFTKDRDLICSSS